MLLYTNVYVLFIFILFSVFLGKIVRRTKQTLQHKAVELPSTILIFNTTQLF